MSLMEERISVYSELSCVPTAGGVKPEAPFGWQGSQGSSLVDFCIELKGDAVATTARARDKNLSDISNGY